MNLSVSPSIYNNRTNYRQNVNFKSNTEAVKKLSGSGFCQDAIAKILKSKKEIREIIESEKEKIEREKDIGRKTDKINRMVEDCFIDKGDVTKTPWSSLLSAIHRNTPNAMQILTKILLADESRNKMVEDLVKEMTEELNRNREQSYRNTQTLKSKKEIQEIIESEKEKIEQEKDIYLKTNKINRMVEDCFIDKGDVTKTPWSSLWSAIHRNTPNAMQILTRILLADESRNKMVNDLVKEMAEELNRNREQYYEEVRAGIHNSNPLTLKSKKEIQEIIESKKEEIEQEKAIGRKADKINRMVKDCFIDKGDVIETPWSSLLSAILRNTHNAMQILTKILLADESRNKMVDDLVKEMAEELNRNREQNYTRTQSGTTQQKPGSNNPQRKAGWTKEQFVAHIFEVVTDKRFQLDNLKLSEIRNLAKLFDIEEEQVVKLDKHTYYELAKKYHPDIDDKVSSDIFVILNILYEKSPNKS